MNKKGMALSQVFLLVLGIVAIAFFAGLQLPEVSAVSKSQCEIEGGVCGDVNTRGCADVHADWSMTEKSFVSGKCPGPSNMQCCFGALVDPYRKAPVQTTSSASAVTTSTQAPAAVPTPTEDKKSPILAQAGSAVGAAAGAVSLYDKAGKIISGDQTAAELQASVDAQVEADLEAMAAAEDAATTAELEGVSADAAIKEAGFFAKLKYGFFHKAPFKAKGVASSQYSISTGGYMLQTAAFAAAGAIFAITVFKLAGAGERNMKQIEKGAYTAAATTAVTLVAIKLIAASSAAPIAGWMVAGIVAVATGIYAAITYQNFSQEIFTYQLNVWQPESKGEHCTECNDLRYGCSEYQCKSFGADCGILNPGTKDELCDWQNPNDAKPPIMTQLDILDTGYSYNPNEKIQLPDRGVNLVYNNGCIPAFTSVKFGIETDEPAECKIDLTRKFSYDEMISFLSEGPVYTYNHTLEIPSSAFPSNYSLTEAGWAVQAGQDHDFYIRCKDANDNISPYHLVMSFCVDQGPDTTPPTISTNYMNDAYITYNQTSIDNLEVYTNEPADCRWDYKDVSYEKMEQNMTDCSTTVGEYTFPNSYSYGCRTSLSGLKSGEKNKFYIRCEDKPLLKEGSQERRVANEESYELTLQGTNPLVIESIEVNDKQMYSTKKDINEDFLFQDSTDVISINMKVETSQGADKVGSARCSYMPLGSRLRYEFYNNGNFEYTSENTNTFSLSEDYYNYTIQCCDEANNCDSAKVDFIVDTDLSSPIVARAYYEEGNMKVTTDEEADCAYMLDTCNYLFEDGIKLQTKDNLDHFTKWDTNEDLYIKCKDRFGNVPADTCSIVVRATDRYVGKEANIATDF